MFRPAPRSAAGAFVGLPEGSLSFAEHALAPEHEQEPGHALAVPVNGAVGSPRKGYNPINRATLGNPIAPELAATLLLTAKLTAALPDLTSFR